jgi:hypothetical protein
VPIHTVPAVNQDERVAVAPDVPLHLAALEGRAHEARPCLERRDHCLRA